MLCMHASIKLAILQIFYCIVYNKKIVQMVYPNQPLDMAVHIVNLSLQMFIRILIRFLVKNYECGCSGVISISYNCLQCFQEHLVSSSSSSSVFSRISLVSAFH